METRINSPPPYWAIAKEGSTPTRRTRWSRRRRLGRRRRWIEAIGLACLVGIAYIQWRQMMPTPRPGTNVNGLSIEKLREDLARCAQLHTKPVDPIGLGRQRSARYIDGQEPVLIINATVWVGEPDEGTSPEDARAGKGYSWIQADVFLEHGLIKQVGKDLQSHYETLKDVPVYDARGRPLTSGIIDMHSHMGVHSLPTLHGNEDVTELSENITPYARSIDGFQPTDQQIKVIKSGGVTTSLVLPGSSNTIGGEALVVKHAVGRRDGRNETSVRDMLADPEGAWRYMKMACGENAKHVHGKAGVRGPTSRLGESWDLRRAFKTATKMMREQDNWCSNAEMGLERMGGYLPHELEWEGLIAILRGQVHVNVHCYTVTDLEAFVDHTNEFGFPVRAFHHAHQAHLVPEVLKRTWGGDPPALAIFADNMWYKAEAAVGSEYAGKSLYGNGLTPIYVSDNPILNAQHLIVEAAKGYKYGLPYHATLAAVTSAPAERLGLGNRLGKVKPGFDADVVVWDSDPLSVGATPLQVWIDGVAQFDDPVELDKKYEGVMAPDKELGDVIEGPRVLDGDVVFTGMKQALVPSGDEFSLGGVPFNVAVSEGIITCVGPCDAELDAAMASNGTIVRLSNGYLTPSFTAFGSTLGLNAIESEGVTDNGADGEILSRGIDGLALGTDKLRVAHRYGVTRAISAPKYSREGTHHGTSVGFLTGAGTAFEVGAVFSDDVAVHYTLDQSVKRGGSTPPMSSAIGALRGKLLRAVASLDDDSGEDYDESTFLRKVVRGDMPLVITVHSADTIAAVLRVKKDVKNALRDSGMPVDMRMAIIGGAEAHLVARELASEGVGVVLAPLFSFGVSWDQRRSLTGAPLTNGTNIDVLLDAGVVVAIGLEEDWVVRDLSLLAGVAYANGGGRLNETQAVGLLSGNVYKLLGMKAPDWKEFFAIHEGNPLQINTRVKAAANGGGKVHVY